MIRLGVLGIGGCYLGDYLMFTGSNIVTLLGGLSTELLSLALIIYVINTYLTRRGIVRRLTP